MTLPSMRVLGCAAALFAGAPVAAQGQDVSRIVAATIYTDGAVVERQLRTPGGTRHLQIDCMPPGFSAATLQIDGDPSVHLGDVRSEPLTGEAALACVHGTLDARIRSLEDQKAALKAQASADDLALDYLRRWNGGGVEPAAARPAAGGHAAPAADTLRKSALDLMTEQLRLGRQLQDVDRQLGALQKATHRVPRNGTWSTLRFDLSTAAAATLRLRYPVQDAHWGLAYRAALDTAASTVLLERQAEITQGSGEDWTDVVVTLSTYGVNRKDSAAAPQSWNLKLVKESPATSAAGNLQRVEITGSSIDPFTILPPAAPAAAAAIDTTPVVGVKVEKRAWELLFHTTQPVSLPSDGETHTLALDALTVPVQLRLRAVPMNDLGAYLLAEAAPPAGIWPSGSLQTWRDGSLIRNDQFSGWSPYDEEDGRMRLSFGRDDRVRISIERPPSMTLSTGLFGNQTQRSWGTVLVVSNGHPTPQTLELIDAAPVSHDESVKVVSKYDPAPSVADWQHKPGVNAWTIALPPNQRRQVSVSHQVTYPKDAKVTNLPSEP
jgi:uncharacterized protein (TIGR02231 family)